MSLRAALPRLLTLLLLAAAPSALAGQQLDQFLAWPATSDSLFCQHTIVAPPNSANGVHEFVFKIGSVQPPGREVTVRFTARGAPIELKVMRVVPGDDGKVEMVSVDFGRFFTRGTFAAMVTKDAMSTGASTKLDPFRALTSAELDQARALAETAWKRRCEARPRG